MYIYTKKVFLNLERIRSKRYEPVFKFVENIGGWPLLMKFSEWNMEEFHWQSVAKYYAGLTGKYSLFTIHQRLNPNNTEVKILMVNVKLKYFVNLKTNQIIINYLDY